MSDFKKLVLMVQPSRMQGLIWQAVLKSQGISVIWESSSTDLTESMEQLHQAGLTLPDLLLVDVGLKTGNAFDLCRWCREHQAEVKLILTDCSQNEITDYERRWAMYQGAIDLLPAFQRESLVSNVAEAVKRVLQVLDEHPLDNGALISILLSMKRQIEAKNITLSPQGGQVSKTEPLPQPEPTSPKSVNNLLAFNHRATNGGVPDPSRQKLPRNPKLSYRFGQYPKQYK
jgi:DNA-binding response OmpR family regulator